MVTELPNHATKFCLLRPLKTKRAAEVALEFLKAFWTLVPLTSSRGTAANVINEFPTMWPDCKIVHGRSRHPQTVAAERGALQSGHLKYITCLDGKQWKYKLGNRLPFCSVAKKVIKTQS
ncbi:hypothetical protein AVEN_57843-1 [Araneus ventricosus]|uniref:Uncharacterized protein n=1 Tax=Araneus ventricosus TaxID=182803 RepID=A0A4Y2W0D5_ARAVE|nr:hypothetical protein AVEN_57843-1 [Araneus ventricosus]